MLQARWFTGNFLTHVMVPLCNFKTRLVLIPFDKHAYSTSILKNNTLSLFSMISTTTILMLFVLSKITLTECQARSTNLGIGFEELITNVEMTEKGVSHQTHRCLSYTNSHRTRKRFEAIYVSSVISWILEIKENLMEGCLVGWVS